MFYFTLRLVSLSKNHSWQTFLKLLEFTPEKNSQFANSKNPAVQPCCYFYIWGPHVRWLFDFSLFKENFVIQKRKICIREKSRTCNSRKFVFVKQPKNKLNKIRKFYYTRKLVHWKYTVLQKCNYQQVLVSISKGRLGTFFLQSSSKQCMWGLLLYMLKHLIKKSCF